LRCGGIAGSRPLATLRSTQQGDLLTFLSLEQSIRVVDAAIGRIAHPLQLVDEAAGH
jgi:hypothetical protein